MCAIVRAYKYVRNRCPCTNTLLVPKVEKLTLAPLLGPIGGGLGLGAAASAAGAAAVAGAAAAGSSDALTTSLEEEPILLDLIGNINMVLLEDEDVVVATLSDNINPQAADAMLLLAIITIVVNVFVCVCVFLFW
jgi:hypothetical protein